MPVPVGAVVGTSIAFSFTLFGNAVTQTFMGAPALLVDFPPPSSPDYAARSRLLGRQWPVFWTVGNSFFRPINTLGIFGYAYASWAASSAPGRLGDWRLFAVAALCHTVTVVHSIVNIQPLNRGLSALSQAKPGDADAAQAETMARKWISFNRVRVVMPLIAGSVALWQTLRRR